MRLTRIEIENFKGIGSRQAMELRPVTLLFGPNSAGKSTILHALHYLREVLERGNIDPDVTIAGGGINLGGFSTLVHNHERRRTLILKVTLDISDGLSGLVLPLNGGQSIGDTEFSELPIRYLLGESEQYRDSGVVQTVGLEVNICWSEFEQAPYVGRLAIELDGESVAAIVSPPQGGRAQLTEFNFDHPLLRRAVLPEDDPTDETENPSSISPLKEEIWSLAREMAADRSTTDIPDDRFRIAVATELGALPGLERELFLDIRDPVAEGTASVERTPRVSGLLALLSELVLGPARLVRNHLSHMTYIGPLREIPSRSYRPQVTPDEGRWAHGLAAWDLLYNDRTGSLMEKVNRWLSGDGRLQTGYRLEWIEHKELPVPSAMHQMFERGLNEDDIGELQELYHSLATRTEIVLRDSEKGILVAPSDVGVGISQMIPVVVAALGKRSSILAIEQPELHVHPAIQVGMGDLFIEAATSDPEISFLDTTLMIETHSEHIILRLLRRIRETTDDELPPGVVGLTPEGLSVVYVESTESGVRLRSLAIDPEGDFVDRWPRGFFEERAGELF